MPNAAAAPKRSMLSVNMRSSEQVVVQIPELTTYLAKVPLECAADALRIGFANVTPHPYRVEGICVCESTEWIAAGAAWGCFTFSGGSDEVRPPGLFPKPVVVAGNNVDVVTGARNVPKITWSDWMRFQPSGAAATQLLFRTLMPEQRAVLAVPGFPKMPDLGFRKRLRAQALVRGDYVTRLIGRLPPPELTEHSPIYVIQYRAARPGVQIVVGGDSHLSPGIGFIQMAAAKLSMPNKPIAVWNAAWSGKASKAFWPALNQAIDFAPPSLAVIQGWTANDGMSAEADQAYLERVKASAARAIAAGGIPIIVKGLPRNLFGKPELDSWQRVNAQLDGLVPGALVFDPSPYVEDPDQAGEWLAGLSDDKVHANLQGNLALYEPFKRLIASIF